MCGRARTYLCFARAPALKQERALCAWLNSQLSAYHVEFDRLQTEAPQAQALTMQRMTAQVCACVCVSECVYVCVCACVCVSVCAAGSALVARQIWDVGGWQSVQHHAPVRECLLWLQAWRSAPQQTAEGVLALCFCMGWVLHLCLKRMH